MRTIDNKSDINATFLKKMKHDMRLFVRIFQMLFYYWTTGRRVRKAYRQCEAQGKIYWLDEQGSPEERN